MDDPSDIVRRHGPMVWRSVCRLIGPRRDADAADCFQEVFVAALELQRGSRPQPGVRNWEALLRRIATHKALDVLRRRIGDRGRFSDASVDALVAANVPPDHKIERDELAEELRRALVQIPVDQAEAFCLRHVEAMSYDAIAAQMDTTPNAVGVLIHRARERLRELMNVHEKREVPHEQRE